MTAPTRGSTTFRSVEASDAELVACVIEGDQDALAEVYRRHGSRVVTVANTVLRDRAAAEEVCQDVFVHLARHPQKFDAGRASLCTYLVVMTHGRAVDRLRAEHARVRREERQAGFVLSAREGPEEQAMASSMATEIWAAVSALPAHEAEALRLAYFGDSTYREVARMLGVPEGTVKSRIRSGLRRLRTTCIRQGIITAA